MGGLGGEMLRGRDLGGTGGNLDEEMGEGGPERSPRSPLLCLPQRSGLHGVAQPDSLTHAAGGSVRAPSKVNFQNPTQPAKRLRRRKPTPGRELRENKRKVGVQHPSPLRRTTPAARLPPHDSSRRAHAAPTPPCSRTATSCVT